MCCNIHTLHAGQCLSFFAVFSLYLNMKNLLEIFSKITVFSSSRYIAGCLQKGNAELLQSLYHGSYLMPALRSHTDVSASHSLLGGISGFVETRDGLHHASNVTLGEIGAISRLGKSQGS